MVADSSLCVYVWVCGCVGLGEGGFVCVCEDGGEGVVVGSCIYKATGYNQAP